MIHPRSVFVSSRARRDRFAERGRHQALLAQNGLYAALWQKQQEARALEEKTEGEAFGVLSAAGD